MVRVSQSRHSLAFNRHSLFGFAGWKSEGGEREPGLFRVARVVTLDQRVTEESGVGHVKPLLVRGERDREGSPSRWQALQHLTPHGVDHHYPVVGLIEHIEPCSIPGQRQRTGEAVGVTGAVEGAIEFNCRHPPPRGEIKNEDDTLISARGVEGSIVRTNRHPHEGRSKLVILVVGYPAAPITLTVGLELGQRWLVVLQTADYRDGEGLRSITRGDQPFSVRAESQTVRMGGHTHVPAARRQNPAVGQYRASRVVRRFQSPCGRTHPGEPNSHSARR